MSTPKVLLTIAGFDPSSGAGVTADLATFAAHHCFGTSAITAYTVQSTVGVRRSEPVSAELLAETLACLEDDLPADGVKIGMLGSASNVEAVCLSLWRLKRKIPIVLDPVIRSSSGRELLDLAGLTLLIGRLLAAVDWVTPNLAELGELTGMPADSPATVEAAARALQSRYPGLTVLAKGGHLDQPDDFLLDPGGSGHWLPGVRLDSRATHGTGCALSSALLANLVHGQTAHQAATAAKHYVAEAIRRAPPLGGGHGPMNLHWPLQQT